MPPRFLFSVALLLFFGYIFLEIATFILIGKQIGILLVLNLIMLSSLIGILVLRSQSGQILSRLQEVSRNKQMPKIRAGHRLINCFAAILLIIPGFISSICGLLLLIPILQDFFIKYLVKGGRSRTFFEFYETKPHKQEEKQGPLLDLEPEQYHARDPQKSPWRKP